MMRLFVGNLAFTVTVEDLREWFGAYGPLDSAEVIDDYEGRSRGFGFVTFCEEADAERAMKELHGVVKFSRPLRIQIAKERKPRWEN